MTAPCTYGPNHKPPTKDGELVTCQCPTYNGQNYQIGQSGQSCSITGGSGTYVWSASNTVPSKSGGK
jgi:Zn-finger protein